MKFVCQREDQEIAKTGLKKWKVQEESVHFIMERRQQQNREERDWDLACKGDGFIEKASKKGYKSDTRTMNEWMWYGEKQPHGLSKKVPTNELKDLRS